ncbi:MAG TPA: hypothetical protein VIK72_15740 [Clostridiaceae bacterium]
MKVAEQIAKLNGIIAFNLAMDELDFTNPWRAANVAKALRGRETIRVKNYSRSKKM